MADLKKLPEDIDKKYNCAREVGKYYFGPELGTIDYSKITEQEVQKLMLSGNTDFSVKPDKKTGAEK